MTATIPAQALFVSCLQPSDQPTPIEAAFAVREALLRYGGVAGCAAAVASEYGERPDTAPARMRWALTLAAAPVARLAAA
jgi:hypothetical protein